MAKTETFFTFLDSGASIRIIEVQKISTVAWSARKGCYYFETFLSSGFIHFEGFKTKMDAYIERNKLMAAIG